MSTTEKNLKISSTAFRVLLIMYLLNKKKHSLDELIGLLSENEIVSRSFSKDVILKYINTLRMSGFSVSRTTGLDGPFYHLDKPPFLIDLNDDEIKALAKIHNYLSFLYRPNLLFSVNTIIEKITRYFNDDVSSKFEQYKKESEGEFIDSFKNFKTLITVLEQYCYDKQTILISYQYSRDFTQEITFEPENIEYRNRKVYLYGLNPKISQKQSLQLDYITDIKQLPTRFRNINIDQPVLFRLTGKLARNYRIYEYEEIIDKQEFPPAVVVSNNSGDVDTLLHRLLKYNHYCEIISPAFVRRKMKSLIEDIIINYQQAG